MKQKFQKLMVNCENIMETNSFQKEQKISSHFFFFKRRERNKETCFVK